MPNSMVFLAVSIVFLFSLISGCATNPVTGRSELALMQISTEEEIKLGGEAFLPAIQQMGGEYPDPQLAAYVEKIGLQMARLSERPDLPYQFKVVNDSAPNAFALPGGYIAISRGLLTGLDNEAQLAAVIGHEIGHVTARHSVQGMQRGALLNSAVTVLSGVTSGTSYGYLATQGSQLAAQLLDNSYSREQESESDTLGINYMVRAGYNPEGAVEVQEYFWEMENRAEPDWMGGLFRTHPFSKNRMLANEKYVQNRYPDAGQRKDLVIGSESFRLATARLDKAARGYKLYDEARTLDAKGKLNQAIATYLMAAAAAPDEALILSGLGMAYLKAEDLNSARIHLSKSVQLQDNFFRSQLGLGYVYLRQNNPQQAVTQLEKSVKLMPTLQGAFFLGEGYERVGNTRKALELYETVAKADPQGKIGQEAAKRINLAKGQ